MLEIAGTQKKREGNFVSVSIPVKEISFKISYSQYKNSLLDDRKILVTAVCQIKGGASLLVEKDIVLQDPLLTIKVKAFCDPWEMCWEAATRIPTPSIPHGKEYGKWNHAWLWLDLVAVVIGHMVQMKYTTKMQIFPWHSCAGIFLPVLVNMALMKFSVLQRLLTT